MNIKLRSLFSFVNSRALHLVIVNKLHPFFAYTSSHHSCLRSDDFIVALYTPMQIADQSPPASQPYPVSLHSPSRTNQLTFRTKSYPARGRKRLNLVTLIAFLRLLPRHELLILLLVDHRVLNTTALGEKLLEDGGL